MKHIVENKEDRDLMWFTQSLGYVHQTATPIFYDLVITTRLQFVIPYSSIPLQELIFASQLYTIHNPKPSYTSIFTTFGYN